MTDILFGGVLMALLFSSAFCSGSETALFNLEPTQLAEMGKRRDRLSRLIINLLERHQRLLLTILIANNAINIAYFALAAFWAGLHRESAWASTAITLSAIAGLILFGEILPKVLASARSEAIARLIATPMWGLQTVLSPVSQVTERMLGGLATEVINPVSGVSADELKSVLEKSQAHGVVSTHVKDRLVEVIDLGDKPALSVMTHRLDCTTVRQGATRAEVTEALKERPSSHILVLDEDDNGVGLLTAQDLLKSGKPMKRVRKPLLIPEGCTLSQVLLLFQNKNKTAGIVIDEYGGTSGLLTLAHLGFELMGDGRSEDLPQQPHIEQLSTDSWRVSGAVPLDEWESIIRPEDREGCTTIAGFLAKMTGTIPMTDDRFLYDNLLFIVEETIGNRILRVKIKELSDREVRQITRNHFRGRP